MAKHMVKYMVRHMVRHMIEYMVRVESVRTDKITPTHTHLISDMLGCGRFLALDSLGIA